MSLRGGCPSDPGERCFWENDVFVAVSGPDGAGKTGLCGLLRRSLSSDGVVTSVTTVAPLDLGKDIAARFAALPTPAPGRWAAREAWMAGYFCLCLTAHAEDVIG